MRRATRIRILRWTAALLGVLLLAAGGGVWWALTPYGPGEVALRSLESDDVVTVEKQPEGWVFTPTGDTPRVGLVLYPGARVDARSYAPLAREIASRGYMVVVPPMRLNLAVLSPDAADEAIRLHPGVLLWAVGGHSLGGAMAARYADTNPESVAGLALLAAYPPSGNDLSDHDLSAVSVYGTLDGILNGQRLEETQSHLPEDTRFMAIEGGNHAQFGDYGPQPGDNASSISADDQVYETADAIVAMLLPLRQATR